jgi:hypothetical protein
MLAQAFGQNLTELHKARVSGLHLLGFGLAAIATIKKEGTIYGMVRSIRSVLLKLKVDQCPNIMIVNKLRYLNACTTCVQSDTHA